MSFEAREESRYQGSPINLFLFRYGTATNAVIGYTDAEQAQSFDGTTYAPIPIDGSKIEATGGFDKRPFEIYVPSSSDVAALFDTFIPLQPVSLTIYQGHLTDDDDPIEFLAIWTGKVLSGKKRGPQTTLVCEPIQTSLKRVGLRRRYQYLCPHVLYGTQCGASKAAATVTVTPASIGTNTITLPSGWAPASLIDKYVQGIVEWDTGDGTEVRTILSISGGTVLTISGPTTGLTTQNVRAILGCNHQTGELGEGGDCTDLHDNGPNYGGCRWIPATNPNGSNVNLFY